MSFKNLYVAHIPISLTNPELHSLFKPFGAISASVMLDASTGRSKGYGFVGFSSDDEGRAALQHLHEKHVTVRDERFAMHITPSKHKGREAPKSIPAIFVRNIPNSTTEAEHRSHFSKFGTVVNLSCRDDPKVENMSQLYVEFQTVPEAQAAIDGCHGIVVFPERSSVAAMAKFASATVARQHKAAGAISPTNRAHGSDGDKSLSSTPNNSPAAPAHLHPAHHGSESEDDDVIQLKQPPAAQLVAPAPIHAAGNSVSPAVTPKGSSPKSLPSGSSASNTPKAKASKPKQGKKSKPEANGGLGAPGDAPLHAHPPPPHYSSHMGSPPTSSVVSPPAPNQFALQGQTYPGPKVTVGRQTAPPPYGSQGTPTQSSISPQTLPLKNVSPQAQPLQIGSPHLQPLAYPQQQQIGAGNQGGQQMVVITYQQYLQMMGSQQQQQQPNQPKQQQQQQQHAPFLPMPAQPQPQPQQGFQQPQQQQPQMFMGPDGKLVQLVPIPQSPAMANSFQSSTSSGFQNNATGQQQFVFVQAPNQSPQQATVSPQAASLSTGSATPPGVQTQTFQPIVHHHGQNEAPMPNVNNSPNGSTLERKTSSPQSAAFGAIGKSSPQQASMGAGAWHGTPAEKTGSPVNKGGADEDQQQQQQHQPQSAFFLW